MCEKTCERSPESGSLFDAFTGFAEGLAQGVVPNAGAGIGAPLFQPGSGESKDYNDDCYAGDDD
jgi:hypothetical protein